MPYVDLAGLSRYASRQKERLERDCALLRDMQWTRSEKAGAVSLWPVGGTPLKPTVDFLFTETPPAEGDKGPTNPSTITGVSSVNVGRSGKNLILGTPLAQGASSDITYTLNADGSITFNGSVPSGGDHFYLYTFNRELNRYKLAPFLKAGHTYTLSATASESTNAILYQIYLSISGNVWSNPVCEAYSGQTKNFTIPENTTGMACRYIVVKGKTVDNVTFRAQLECGSSSTTFEKPEYTDYTIPLGNTYYGGTLDVSTGVMTVKSQKVSLDSSCSFGYYDGASTESLAAVVVQINSLPVANDAFITDRCACNKFPIHTRIDGEESIGFTSPTYSFYNKQIRVYLKWTTLGVSSSSSSQEIIAAARDWFIQNPVELVVTFKDHSSTVQLDPVSISALVQSDKYTPRLNTIYSDQQSVQVGYVKSPIRDEYELQQAVIAQGGNV